LIAASVHPLLTSEQAAAAESQRAAARAAEPAWARPIIARERHQAMLDATPIHLRPNRPFHFYGNTIRRKHYRGSPLLLPRDLWNTAAALLGLRCHLDDFSG